MYYINLFTGYKLRYLKRRVVKSSLTIEIFVPFTEHQHVQFTEH